MFGLSAFRFLDILETIANARAEEERRAYHQSAFVGWQITEFLKGALEKNPNQTNFQSYLINFNLMQKTTTTKKQREEEVKRKIAKAEEIKARDLA